jgi:cytochrome c peroxidase
MKRLLLTMSLGAALLLSACQKDGQVQRKLSDELTEVLSAASPTGSPDYFRMPSSTDLQAIPQDPNNPLTSEKVELGKLLYHETGIALAPKHEMSKGTYSCASCHFASAGFQAGRWQGIGDGGAGFGVNGEGRIPMLSHYTGEELDVQPIRTPTAMNGAWQEIMLWNGQFGATGMNEGTEYSWTEGTPKETNMLGFQGLETQAIAGLEVHRMVVNEEIVDTLGYKDQFDAVFADYPQAERYSLVTAGLAIAAYERTLLSNEAPFQKWLQGDQDALSEQELRGALLFFDEGQANCASCHTGPALNSMTFYALGMKDLYQIPEETFKANVSNPEVLGRGGFTGENRDMYKFKTPQLYNLADSRFYGHGSSFHSIAEVVVYKNRAIPENVFVTEDYLADEFQPLNLDFSQMEDLITFLTSALYDPNLQRYEPESLPSGNCFPVNDPQGRIDLGCD